MSRRIQSDVIPESTKSAMESCMNTTQMTVHQFYEGITRGETQLDVDKIGFLNIGYWKGVEDSLEIAQINLIETLVEFLSRREGNVLDVACGKGASTKFLTKYFDPRKIVGTNISEIQLQVCRAIAPECSFKLMDATRLEFPEGSIDNVLCIEAAQHFKTRHKFFEQAYRVMAPGGRLAIHDVVFHDPHRSDAPNPDIWPKENYLPNLEVYEANLSKIGFRYVRVEDITEFSKIPEIKYLMKKMERELQWKESWSSLENAKRVLRGDSPWSPSNCSWCMAFAIK